MAENFYLVVGVLVLAGFVQGLSGFGFGLVSMSLMPMLIDFHSASTVVVAISLMVIGFTMLVSIRHFPGRSGLALVLGTCCGAPLGFYVLVKSSPVLLIHILGAILLASSINELIVSRKCRFGLPASWGFPVGLLSGGMGGAFNIGGPPAVVYCYAQPWTKEQSVAVLQVTFFVASLVRIALGGAQGSLTPELMNIATWSVAPVIVAILIGRRFFQRIPQEKLRVGVFVFLAILGVKYLLPI